MKKVIFISVLFVGSVLVIGNSKSQTVPKNDLDLTGVEHLVDVDLATSNSLAVIIPPKIPTIPPPTKPTKPTKPVNKEG